jgi:hypothetical protein
LGPVLVIPLAMLFVLVLLRALLRKEWAAAAAFVLLFTFLSAALSQFAPVVLVIGLIYWGLLVFLLIRFGLLAFAAHGLFVSLLSFPLTTQGSAWYAGISLAGILLMAAMAFYGFYTSLGGPARFRRRHAQGVRLSPLFPGMRGSKSCQGAVELHRGCDLRHGVLADSIPLKITTPEDRE